MSTRGKAWAFVAGFTILFWLSLGYGCMSRADERGFLWRGFMQVCASNPGAPPTCSAFRTNDLFDSEAICNADMDARTALYLRRVRTALPGVLMSARFKCMIEPGAGDA